MKFTLSWLRDHLETTATLDDICTTLTAIGLEVDAVHNPAALLAPFTVALIESTAQHPNADKLKVCTVNTGTEKLQIVCGAPNARAGIRVVLSRPGDFIPGLNITLGASTIRGVESQGMLCAEDELGLGTNHDGIMELPADAPLGARLVDVMATLADPVIDINLTPNRGDCAGVRGIARDLAAAGLGTLRPLPTKTVQENNPTSFTASIENPDDCPAVAFRLIKGVTNGESPAWLKQKLESIGIKPISALVDITNFFTFDRARPLHVFDAATLHGNLHIRRARAGETLMALNNKEYALSPDMLVIADDAKVESIAGVMGGLASGVSATTRDVVLEVALFNPVRVAASGRLLQLNSDARYRFERGLDPASLESALNDATAMIIEICGGTAHAPARAGSIPAEARRIHFFPTRVAEIGGVDVPVAEQEKILTALGCTLRPHHDHYDITPPTWRPDLTIEEDLVEEILRIHGYDAIPATPLPSRHMKVALSAAQRRTMTARRALAMRGLAECVTWSFMPSALAAHFAPVNPALTLLNPISADLDQMRPSIIGNLLQAAAHNAAHGTDAVALFEVGPIFSAIDKQETVATALRAGPAPRHWAKQTQAADFFTAKADALALLAQFGLNPDTLPVTPEAPHYYHPGRSGVVRLGPVVVAAFGELHPALCTAAGLDDTRAIAIEIFLDRLPAAKASKSGGHAKPLLHLPPLQAVRRDFAFVVDATTPADKLVKAVKGADKTFITAVDVFDVYEGDKMPVGKKSVALSVTLQPQGDKAFTDAELEGISTSIVAAAAKTTGAVLR